MTDRTPFEEIERVFDQVTEGLAAGPTTLPVDVVDDGEAFVLRADLPGVDSEDVDVRVTDGREVTIEATEDQSAERSGGTYVVRERRHGTLRRSVTLPAAVAEEEAEASFDAGVLEVTLPKFTTDTGAGTEIPVN